MLHPKTFRQKAQQCICSVTLLLAIALLIKPQPVAAEAFIQRDSVQEYIRTISKQHGLDQNRVAGYFARTSPLSSVLESIARPAEKVLTWADYRPIFIKQKRIDAGVAFVAQHKAAFTQAEEQYGVPAEIIAAIIGVESFYGRFKGKHGVLESVATLAFDYPPRSKFFTQELTEFIVLAESEGWDVLDVKGSYAGAMGFPQFISSSYRAYAVDMDNDGKRDLFNSPDDVIGSVANYLAQHGWKRNQLVATDITDQKASHADLKSLVRKSLKPAIEVQTLRAKGVDVVGSDKVSVMSFSGSKGDEYWVGYPNFYAITRYNHSRLYALAVHQFSLALAKRGV